MTFAPSLLIDTNEPTTASQFYFKAASGNIILLIASVKLIEDTKFLLSVGGGAMIYVTLNAPEPHQMAQRMGSGFKGWGWGSKNGVRVQRMGLGFKGWGQGVG